MHIIVAPFAIFFTEKMNMESSIQATEKKQIVLLLRQRRRRLAIGLHRYGWRTPRVRPVNVGFPNTYVHLKVSPPKMTPFQLIFI